MSKKRLYLVLGMLPIAVILLFGLLIMYLRSDAYSGLQFSEEKEKKHILLDGDQIVSDEDQSLKIGEDHRIIIYEGGTYCFEGQMDDGQIIINAGDEEKVVLHFDGVDIHCEDSAPLWIKNAGKVVIRMKAATENSLSDGEVYTQVAHGEKQPNACIYSRADLVIKTSAGDSGEAAGSLTVAGNYKNGISCSEDIKIKSGDVRITAAASAIKTTEDFKMNDGSLILTAGKDAIYSEERVSMQAGHVQIDSNRYGIFGKEEVQISDSCEMEIKNAISQIASHGS